MANSRQKGLNSARSPGSISNAEHHDPTGASRGMDGTPLTIRDIVDASTEKYIDNQTVARVINTDVAIQYLWIGKESEIPVTVDVTNGIALAPNQRELVYSGTSDDPKESLMIKSSSALVQVAIMEN